MKKILILLLILTSTSIYSQGKELLLFDDSEYYLWNAVTGSNLVTDTDIFLYGSFTREQVPKDSLDDFGDGLVQAGSRTASKYIVFGIDNGYVSQFRSPYNGTVETDESFGIFSRLTPFTHTREQGEAHSGQYYSDVYTSEEGTYIFLTDEGGYETPSSINTYYLDSGNVSLDTWYYSIWIKPRFDHNNITDVAIRDEVDGLWLVSLNSQIINGGVGWQRFKVSTNRSLSGLAFYVRSTNDEASFLYDDLEISEGDYNPRWDYDSVRTLARVIDANDLIEDTTYIYYCTVLQPNGRYSKGADETFRSPLRKPEYVVANGQADKISLSWSGSPKSKYFYIQRSSSANGTYSVIDSTTSVVYVDSGLGEATWYYKIFAKNADKTNTSSSSSYVEGTSTAIIDSLIYSPTMFLLAAMDTAQAVIISDSVLADIDTTMIIDTLSSSEDASFLKADAETGDISQFTGIDDDGVNNMVAIDSLVNNGDYSFLLESQGSADHRYYYTYSGSTDSVCTRFYFYMPSNYPFSSDATLRTYYLLRIRNGSTIIGGIQIRANTTTHNLYRYFYTSDGGLQTVTPTAQSITLDTWHYIEYRHKKGNGTGYVKVYYDGSLWAEATGLTMTSVSFNDFNYGISSASTAPATGQYLVLDDVLIDESPIGAYSASGGSIDTSYTYDSTYTVTSDTLGTDSTVVLNVYNAGTSMATINSVTGLAYPFSTDFDNINGVSIPSKQSYDINIIVDRNHPIGLAEDTIIVNSNFDTKEVRISVDYISPALTPPIDFTVTHNSDTTGFLMYWNDPLGTDSIEIYRSTDNVTFTKIATVAEDIEQYTDSPYAKGTTRYYATKTKRGTKLSEFSEVGFYTLPDDQYIPPDPSDQNEIEDGIKDWFLSANGTGTGANNWDNSANYYTFNWSQVLSGDSVFIDGGTDSVVYTQKLNPSIAGTSGNYITIGGGKSEGHNGRVILRVSGDYTIGSLSGSRQYLIFRKMVLSPATTNTAISLGGGSNLIFEYLTVYAKTHGIQCQGGSDLTIRYCRFESPRDYSASQADLMAFYNNARRIKIHNNFLVQHNEDTAGQLIGEEKHNDCIQANIIGSTSFPNENTLLIYNNILWQNNTKDTDASVMMISQVSGWTTFYNNLVIGNPYHTNTGLGNQPIDRVSKTRMWHNTIVDGANAYNITRFVSMGNSDTMDVVNNVIYSGYPVNNLAIVPRSGLSAPIKRIEGNAYYSTSSSWNPTTSNVSSINGTERTLAEMKSQGWDDTGISTNPLLVNPVLQKDVLGDYSLQDGSPAKNIGINIKAEVEALGMSWTDINGNLRDLNPHAGAYEAATGETPNTPTCTYVYSDWGECINDIQTRTVVSSSPEGCEGTPVLTRACESTTYPTTVVLQATGTIDQDDMCFWVHPTDSTLSTVISSDKTANRLFVYGLDGSTIQSIGVDGVCGNVDIIYGLSLGGTPTDLVAFNDRTNDVIKFYSINSSTRQLTARGSFSDGGMTSGNYGLATYKSPYTNKWYVFVSSQASQIKQWELTDNSGNVGGTLKRTFTNGTGLTEGMVCDNETGDLFAGNEDTGLYRIEAEPDSATTRYTVALAGQNGLTADLEGVAIYYDTLGTGYILLSSQGSDNVKVYERKSPYTYVGTFAISGASDMDGLDVNNHNFGVRFPKGIFAIHNGLQRVILTDWQTIVNTNTFLRQPNTTYYDSRNP